MSRWIVVSLLLALLAPRPALAAPAEPTAMVLGGEAESYRPMASFSLWKFALTAPLSVAFRLEGQTPYAVDARGGELSGDPALNLQTRIGLTLNSGTELAPVNVGIAYEHDLLTGVAMGKPELAGEGLPDSEGMEHQIRKAKARVSLGRVLHLQGGIDTSQWGLGLLANDGAQVWTPGSARFTDPRGGDRVLRLMLSSGPLTHLGLVFALGYDWVQGDDVVLEGDRARQFVGAFSLGHGRATGLGFYGVFRTQEAEDGDLTEVGVVDLYLRTRHPVAGLELAVELEAALITGSTTLAASPELPEKDVLQVAVAARASLSGSRLGGVLDLLFASGDADFDDTQQTGFKVDPNYHLGLLLYRQVLAGQSGRAAYTAGDPNLVGYAAEDLARLPTRQSITNTIAIFPRAWWRPLRGLEVYGGPLLAFTAVPLADPLASKLAGGAARNALGGDPGSFLGAELDLGSRFQMMLWGTELTVGLELGVFIPGDALQDAAGETMSPLFGGRGLVGYRF